MEFLAKRSGAQTGATTLLTTKQKGDAAEDAACAICRRRACSCWSAIIGRPGAAAAKST